MPHQLRIVLTILLAGCAGNHTTTTTVEPPPPTACTFTNPIAAGADPWVVKKDGFYYYVQSRDNAIWISKTQNLTDIGKGAVRVWSAPASGWNRTNIWAPELHFVDGRWYIYYAGGSGGPPFISQRSGVLEAATDDPQGAWTDRGMLYTGDDVAGQTDNKWAIDLTVDTIAGQLYAIWSGWEQNATTDKTPQQLYIARMSNPYTIASNRVMLSAPTASWEIGPELDLQEGPEVLRHGSDAFVVYSTRDSWLPSYALGQLRLTPGADPMNAASWTKSSGPVFTGAGAVYGVGHASFTTSPDGAESWIVYHTKTSTAPGWDRVVQMQKFGWSAGGAPDFGTPAQPGVRLAQPSGECR